MYNLKIKVSDSMTEYSGMYTNENGMIRIPKTLQQQTQLEVGQSLQFNTVDKKVIVLKVGAAYQSDTDDDNSICYVTKQVFEQINIENTEYYKMEPINNITLGCDPEFFLIDKYTRKVLRAYLFFKKWGEVGCDGVLAELRPKPSTTPLELTDNIYELICTTRNIINTNSVYDPERITLHAASGYQMATAGFHLHFGLPKNILGKTPNTMLLMHQVVRVMDYYIGIPAIMLEGNTDAARRSNIFVTYGKPGDFRLDDRTLEYRVAGGSLLRHPILTRGLIALGEVVTQDVISRIKLSTNGFKHLYWAQSDERLKEMYPDILNTIDTYNIICSPSIMAAKNHLDRIYSGIKKMISYEKRKNEIDELFNLILTDVQFNNNIEYNWRNFYEQVPKLHKSSNKTTALSTAG